MVEIVLPRAVGSQGPAGPMGPGATDQQVASVVTPIVDAKTAGKADKDGSNVEADAFRGAIGAPSASDLASAVAPLATKVDTDAALLAFGDLPFWTPDAMPAANGAPGDVANHNGWGPADYINNLYEPLRAGNPSYITRDFQGKDESGLYDIWRYSFVPERPTRTILLTCGVHGFERLSITGTFLLLREVVSNWRSHPALAFLRHNCAIHVIPVLNPWGVAQSPKSRYNVNGVDLNRNWPWRWESWNAAVDGQPKGSAPASEAETQIAVAMLNDFPEADVYIDVHDVNSPGAAPFICYGPTPSLPSGITNIAQQVFEYMKNDGDTLLNFYTAAPNSFNYGAARGLLTANLEATTDGSGTNRWSSAAMTRAVGWYGNCIMQAARKARPQIHCINGPNWVYMAYAAGSGGETQPSVTGTNFTEIQDFRVEIPSTMSGVLSVRYSISGDMSGLASGAYGQVNFCPMIGHEQNPVAVASSPYNLLWESTTDVPQGRRGHLSGIAAIPIGGDNSAAGSGQGIRIGMFGKVPTPSGAFKITRFNMEAQFFPSDSPNKYRLFRATGRGGMGVGAMQEVDY